MLLYRWLRPFVLFNIGGYHHRLYLREADTSLFAPREKLRDRSRVTKPCIFVSDVSGKELKEAFGGLPSFLRDDAWKWKRYFSRRGLTLYKGGRHNPSYST